jgi:hypothetical protein
MWEPICCVSLAVIGFGTVLLLVPILQKQRTKLSQVSKELLERKKLIADELEKELPWIVRRGMTFFVGKGRKERPYCPTPRNDGLRFLSIANWLRAGDLVFRSWDNFSEKWGWWMFVLSLPVLIAYAFYVEITPFCLQALLFCLVWLRIIEIIAVQTGVMLFDSYQFKVNSKPYRVRSLHRLAILLALNYAETIVWFAVLYYFSFVNFEAISLDKSRTSLAHTALGAFHFSFFIMTTFGEFNDVTAIVACGWWSLLVLFQTGIGLLMALLVLARFIGSIPPPDTEDRFER